MIRETKPAKAFCPFPAYNDRDRWNDLPEEIKNYYSSSAEKIKGKEWRSLPASVCLDFYRNGSNVRNNEIFFERRRNLFILFMAECIEGNGVYLDDIIDGVWLLCEETGWVHPAHYKHFLPPGKSVRELQDVEADLYIDLYAAETGSLLSWVYYFLGDVIGGLSPLVKRRIEFEIERRILKPYLKYDYGWMGLNNGGKANNWNPWINANILVMFLVFTKSFPYTTDGISRTVKSVNRFIDSYADDGGCDEGPGYFNAAAASLLDFIEELGQITDVSYLYADKKFCNMVSYIYKVYIGKKYYVNYADAPPLCFPPVSLLARTGKKSGDDVLVGFSNYLRDNRFCVDETVIDDLARQLYRLLAAIFMEKDDDAGRNTFTIPMTNWFPGIQVVTARDNEGSFDGLFFSAKGGHNNESHNHNDVGNFILYCDRVPVLVDAGVETYTKSTFSEKRYTLWTMRSCYHNTPTINGTDQVPGAGYCAAGISFSSSEGRTRFSLDIGGAYPAETGINSYKREFIFKHNGDLTITDSYSLKECTAPLILNLLCYEKPEISGGKAILGGKVTMYFDALTFSWAVEEIPLTDKKIHDEWQTDNLYRLRLTKKTCDLSGEAVLRFTR
jgi:hypothetical protein